MIELRSRICFLQKEGFHFNCLLLLNLSIAEDLSSFYLSFYLFVFYQEDVLRAMMTIAQTTPVIEEAPTLVAASGLGPQWVVSLVTCSVHATQATSNPTEPVVDGVLEADGVPEAGGVLEADGVLEAGGVVRHDHRVAALEDFRQELEQHQVIKMGFRFILSSDLDFLK